jgi:hypothetical protein
MFYDSGLALIGLWWLADRVTASPRVERRSGRWASGGVDGCSSLGVGLCPPAGRHRCGDAVVAMVVVVGWDCRRAAGMADIDAKFRRVELL